MIYYPIPIEQHIIFHWAQNVQVRSKSGQIRNIWPPGSGSLSQDFGSADPNPKEIFTDAQHWLTPLNM
jgi:hypothetical protein